MHVPPRIKKHSFRDSGKYVSRLSVYTQTNLGTELEHFSMECCWMKIEVSTSINQTKKKWPMKTLTSINCLKQLFIWIWLVQGIKDRDWSIGESFVWHFLWHVSPFSFSFSPLFSHRISPYSTPVGSISEVIFDCEGVSISALSLSPELFHLVSKGFVFFWTVLSDF